MNPLSQRSRRENTISREPADSATVAKSKLETKAKLAVASYDYEAAISQPDIPTRSEIDNDTRKPCLDVSPASNEKANFFSTYGKMNVTIKRRGIGIRSKVRPKKITKARAQIRDVVEVKREPKFCTNVYPDVTTNQETSPINHQEELTKAGDIRKQPETAVDENRLESKAICKQTVNLRKDGNTDETVENTRLCDSRNKASKIPRIKSNFFLPTDEEFRVYPIIKLPVRNRLKGASDIKSPVCNEGEKLLHQVHVYNESNDILRKKTLDRYQESRVANIARVVRGNSTNLFLESFENSSEADVDFEELEADLPTLTSESPIIISADDAPRSASMKSSSLKCECRSRGDRKYTSAVRKGRYTETDYGSSSEMESTRRKSMEDSEFTDMSSEDTDLLSDYAVGYNRVKMNDRNKEASRHTCRVMKPSLLTNNSARMRTTSFSFFNVFFDIVFWPFILLRTKQ